MLHILQPTGLPVGVEPRVWRKAIRERIDQHLASVEALLAALDSMDTDCDLEDDGTLEASLGWTERGPGASGGQRYPEVDLEADFCDDEDNGDTEPNGDERDCDLAGATTDLEYDYGFYDGPLHIEGGQGL